MEGTYEYELERAELLGVDPLSREEWEKQNQARLQAQLAEQQNEIAQEIQADEEKIQGGHGKMDELNNILNATQMKLNKFKVRNGIKFYVSGLKAWFSLSPNIDFLRSL